LLEREHKKYRFNDFGDALVEKSKRLLHPNRMNGIEFAESASDGSQGTLRLG